MNTIIIKTQEELGSLPDKFETYTRIEIRALLRIVVGKAWENSSVEAWGNSSVEARENSSVVARENSSVVAWENSSVVARENSSVVAWENSSVVAWGNSSVEAWGNSSVEAWGNSSVMAWENSSVMARENSSVEARGNSSVEAWGNSSVMAWENSSVEARGNSSVMAWENSSVVAWENSSVEARGQSLVRAFSADIKLALHGFSILSIPLSIDLKFEFEKTCMIQRYETPKYLDREGVPVTRKTAILFKKVSSDFKTQEGTRNETLWAIGSTVTHPAWNPTEKECGEGKFHACSRPYFCDEFRNNKGDRYIAVQIKTENLHEWADGSYPHKIAFREGKVLYECTKHGREIKE